MSIEGQCFVRLRAKERERAEALHEQALRALARSKKGLPGDRGDIVRYEALCTGIEQIAASARLDGATSIVASDAEAPPAGNTLITELKSLPRNVPKSVHSWVKAGSAVVELRLPLLPGMPEERSNSSPQQTSAAPVAKVWKAEGPRREAQIERLQSQFDALVNGDPDAAVRPSGVPNTVLTDTLRTYVNSSQGKKSQIDAPVLYRDGSVAEDFPLRCLRLRTKPPASGRVLRFVLLSIRHMDSDFAVDGAWFRNTLISLPRQAALTDAVATEQTTLQLDRLCSRGPVEIRLYQTGLDSAIIGFYRGVVRRLLDHPKSLVVVPYFFREGKKGAVDFFQPGKPWAA